ncbi:MAG: hypothetical protein AAGC72_11895 [Planctomycetota bacterium]
MPVYLFTLHAYGSWLPNHRRGYTRRREGILPTDPNMAACYQSKMTQDTARFDDVAQQIIVSAVQEKAAIKQWSAHAIATDPTHAHILLSWEQPTDWLLVRRGLKASLTRALSEQAGKRHWLSEGGSRKRIKDQTHFDHLIQAYLPSHRGLLWINPKHQPRQRNPK